MQDRCKESDWKRFRDDRKIALDRFCRRVLDEVAAHDADAARSNYERYLAIYALIRKRDRELARLFDGAGRSSMFFQLAGMRAQKLITDEEMSQYSPDLQEKTQRLLSL